MMNLLKLAGLVLGLALVATASLATGSAAAEPTKLCKANEEKCSKENTYHPGPGNVNSAILNPGDESKLVMPGLASISCPTGKLALTVSETAGPMTGEVFKWNGARCGPAEECTLMAPTEFETGFSASVEAIGKGNGVLTIGLNPTLIAKCTTFTCTYTVTAMKFSIQGGVLGTANFSNSEVAMKKDAAKSSLICPSTALYTSRFTIVEPGLPLFVTH
jgi:hypothetical protein